MTYAEAVDLAELLKTPESLGDLSVSLDNVGRAAEVAGDDAWAAEAYGESLKVRRDLAERVKTPESQRDLCVSLYMNGLLAIEMSQLDRAKIFVEEEDVLAKLLPEFMRSEIDEAFDRLREQLGRS